jgi:hypothetical protein
VRVRCSELLPFASFLAEAVMESLVLEADCPTSSKRRDWSLAILRRLSETGCLGKAARADIIGLRW